ncbi:MAG: ATP-binding protein [bacterium]
MKSFRLNLIFRILLLSLSIFTAFYLYFNSFSFVWIVVLIGIVFFQILLLVNYVDKTNHLLSGIFESIYYSDFSQHFDFSKLGKSFKDLSEQFNKVFNKMKETRNEKEESLNYLHTVVQHVGVGLISFDSKGDVEFINRAAKNLLRINTLKNISSLNEVSENFGEFIKKLPPKKKVTYRYSTQEDSTDFLLYATEFRMRGDLMRLIAIQNIESELDEKEIEAWQKLIRVLTHEIMNSITPISSLASTLNKMLPAIKETGAPVDTETYDDISSAVNTIQKRSDGLLNFVDKYRSFTKVPKLNIQPLRVSQLFNRIKLLMDSALGGRQIQFKISVIPDSLEINVDSDLVEQVLINLLNNAIQSIGQKENGSISLSAFIDERGRAIIQVSDNGAGIPEDIMDKIFIPFFSTKKEGSGVGLSISRQIIRAHGGNIRVSSVPNKDTVFTLRF